MLHNVDEPGERQFYLFPNSSKCVKVLGSSDHVLATCLTLAHRMYSKDRPDKGSLLTTPHHTIRPGKRKAKLPDITQLQMHAYQQLARHQICGGLCSVTTASLATKAPASAAAAAAAPPQDANRRRSGRSARCSQPGGAR